MSNIKIISHKLDFCWFDPHLFYYYFTCEIVLIHQSSSSIGLMKVKASSYFPSSFLSLYAFTKVSASFLSDRTTVTSIRLAFLEFIGDLSLFLSLVLILMILRSPNSFYYKRSNYTNVVHRDVAEQSSYQNRIVRITRSLLLYFWLYLCLKSLFVFLSVMTAVSISVLFVSFAFLLLMLSPLLLSVFSLLLDLLGLTMLGLLFILFDESIEINFSLHRHLIKL